MEVLSVKSGVTDDKTSVRGSLISLPEVVHGGGAGGAGGLSGYESESDAGYAGMHTDRTEDTIVGLPSGRDWLKDNNRPHTVDTSLGVPRHPQKVTFKVPDDLKSERSFCPTVDESVESNYKSDVPITPQLAGLRVKHLASTFRPGTVDSFTSAKSSVLGEKYNNILPRFYPALTAHKNRQFDAERSLTRTPKKKSAQQRLVRFADNVRVSTDSGDRRPIDGVVASRAPMQSVQRALDSHSGMQQADRLKPKLKDFGEFNHVKPLSGRLGNDTEVIVE